ncbi:MAG: TIGR00730 family Rossman fold protein [Phycisphaerales bacterium]|nr:MAG: TIGR00730 family Rossman fold protein [Phycisphaerales bacterium]
MTPSNEHEIKPNTPREPRAPGPHGGHEAPADAGAKTPVTPGGERTPPKTDDASAGGGRFPEERLVARLNALIEETGADPTSYDGKLVRDLLVTSLKLIRDGRDTGELKLLSSAVKELRHAYRVFANYSTSRRVSIFGSARTPPKHPDYKAAVEFSRMMAALNWHVITGAGGGIMQAGHEGPGREASFGLAIHLPFETSANEIIAGDSKLINFRYFFTRKVMFMSQADAVVTFPGGFGTMDEIFEALTLVQTGKAAMKPIVLCEGEGGDYWRHWENYMRRSLLDNGFISPEDRDLYYIADDPADAAKHIERFYRNYHSSRYVRDDFIIRLNARLREEDVERLNNEFASIVREGKIVQRGPYDAEVRFLDLPRLAFTHTRHHFGLLRLMIDRINSFDPITEPAHPPNKL